MNAQQQNKGINRLVPIIHYKEPLRATPKVSTTSPDEPLSIDSSVAKELSQLSYLKEEKAYPAHHLHGLADEEGAY